MNADTHDPGARRGKIGDEDALPESRREEGRPDPEELLARYNLRDSDLPASSYKQASKIEISSDEDDEESQDSEPNRLQRKRGRLRVYLGAAAGSGKTYAMLNEGHRRESRGTDVVIGYVET